MKCYAQPNTKEGKPPKDTPQPYLQVEALPELKPEVTPAGERRRTVSLFLGEVITQAFSINRPIALNPVTMTLIDQRTGKPLGQSFIRRVERNPDLAEPLASKARARYRKSLPILEEMEGAVDDKRVSIEGMARMCMDYFATAHSGGLDYVFDAQAYRKTIKRHLREWDARTEREVDLTLTHIQGIDAYLSFKKRALQYLAGEFGRNSGDIGAHTFIDFDWNWYRRNYVPLKARWGALGTTEDYQRGELQALMDREGIRAGDYDAVVGKLRELHREQLLRQRIRLGAVDYLMGHAKPGSEAVVRALTHFAGESITIDDEMHITSSKALILLGLAAEKRGVSLYELWDIAHAAAKEKAEQIKQK